MHSVSDDGTDLMDYQNSYYASTLADTQRWPSLDGTLDVEVCVVGGGLAGVATALDLAERGRSVALLEQNRIGWGASGRSGGFVSQGFHQGAAALLKRLGKDRTRGLLELSRMGHELLRSRIERYQVDCGPMTRGGLSCALDRMSDNALEQYQALVAENFGVELEYWPRARVSDVLETTRYGAALFNPETFSVHPLNLVRGLVRAAAQLGCRVFEQSPATALGSKGGNLSVRTVRGIVRAEKIVLTCGGYIGGLCRPLSHATVPVSSYVVVTEPLGQTLSEVIGVPFAISDLQFLPNYYRKLPDGRLLWGGRAAGWEPSAAHIAQLLKRDMGEFYPRLAGVKVEFAWSGLMSYLAHEMLALGQIEPGIWYATGFGGLGLATTTMAGWLIGSAIAENDDRWRQLDGFGLPYAGGSLLAPFAAQMSIWYELAKEKLGHMPDIA